MEFLIPVGHHTSVLSACKQWQKKSVLSQAAEIILLKHNINKTEAQLKCSETSALHLPPADSWSPLTLSGRGWVLAFCAAEEFLPLWGWQPPAQRRSQPEERGSWQHSQGSWAPLSPVCWRAALCVREKERDLHSPPELVHFKGKEKLI